MAASAPKKPRRWRARLVAAAVLAGLAAGAYFGYPEYQVFRLRRSVRELFAMRRYGDASVPLQRWLALRPSSGEAHYYQAWNALVDDRPDDAVRGIEQAKKLSFHPELVDCLSAIYYARALRYDKAEPILGPAFSQELDPRELIAKELARIYLSTFRMPQAAQAIERWRTLAPDDPRPYLWRNEIACAFRYQPCDRDSQLSGGARARPQPG